MDRFDELVAFAIGPRPDDEPPLRAVVILDQFFAPSPYWLSQQRDAGTPYRWADFLVHLGEDKYTVPGWRTPTVQQVDAQTFRCPWASTVVAEDEDGNVIAWRTNWDSSD
jgi:hypothetical protein